MLRNRNRNGNFMAGYHEPTAQPVPSPSGLDPQNERLLDLSEVVGQLGSQNEMLNEDNRRLEQENEDLRERNGVLQKRNTELERQEAGVTAGYKSGSQLVEEIEAALKARKETK